MHPFGVQQLPTARLYKRHTRVKVAPESLSLVLLGEPYCESKPVYICKGVGTMAAGVAVSTRFCRGVTREVKPVSDCGVALWIGAARRELGLHRHG